MGTMSFFTVLALSLSIVPNSFDALPSCPQSEAEPQRRSGTCHFQKTRDSWGLPWYEESDAPALDTCEADCSKRLALMQIDTSNTHCEEFCLDNGCPCLQPWVVRCQLKSCAGCPACVGSGAPTELPTRVPTNSLTQSPTDATTDAPTEKPTRTPTEVPTKPPTEVPTKTPTEVPTKTPTKMPTETTTPAPLACGADCPGYTATWESKCQWQICEGCSTCETTCLAWCQTDTATWENKCKSTHPCHVCDDCAAVTTTTTTRPPIPPCFPDSVQMDFALSQLQINNLGGNGPWGNSEKMLYKNVLTNSNGELVDLEITNLTAYQPDAPGGNGKHGAFGNINLANGHSVDLRFRFIDGLNGLMVTLNHFEFTFVDIDQDNDQGNAQEKVTVYGADDFKAVQDTEVDIHKNGDSVEATSTKGGHQCDNPTWPELLGNITCNGQTIDQQKRAVMFLFSDKSEFNVSISVKAPGSPRNILFSGASTLVDLC